MDAFEECLRHDADNRFAFIGLADCYRAKRDYHRAIEIWEQYLDQGDEDIAVLTRIGDAYRKVGDRRQSKEIYLQALASRGRQHLCLDRPRSPALRFSRVQ